TVVAAASLFDPDLGSKETRRVAPTGPSRETPIKGERAQSSMGHRAQCKIADNSDPLRGIYASNSDPF
ncbi:MAG: hypothetical protein QOD93_4141, partial [Acetobacteraceae bacterium]|nr:hypothetical protein [Acetobacteraceae bacterium]